MLEQAVELKHHADLAAERAASLGRRWSMFEHHAVDIDPARLERLEAGDGAEDRRLAGARRSHDRDEFAALDLECNAAENLAIAAVESQLSLTRRTGTVITRSTSRSG